MEKRAKDSSNGTALLQQHQFVMFAALCTFRIINALVVVVRTGIDIDKQTRRKIPFLAYATDILQSRRVLAKFRGGS